MLELRNIVKKYKEFEINDISIKVDYGDYFVLLGESGAGKSIILEIIAGLISPDSGSVFLNNEDITRKKIQNRGIGLVFQDYAVFPHLNVFHNIAFPIKRKFKKEEIAKRVNEIAKILDIFHLIKRNPETLSGGELQRVALARTLVLEPKLLLLDEPLASLDIQLKDGLRSLLRKLNLNGITIVHVTHDYYEAIALASKVGIVNQGKIVQTGTPKEVFHNPKSRFVANFTGIKNFYNAQFINSDSLLLEGKVKIFILENLTIAGECYAFFRAEDVILSKQRVESSAINQFHGKIMEIIPKPEGVEIITDIGVVVSAIITRKSLEKLQLKEDEKIWVSFKGSSVDYVVC